MLFFMNLWAAIAPGWWQVGVPAAVTVWPCWSVGCGSGLSSSCAMADMSKAQLCKPGWLDVRPGAHQAEPREQAGFPKHSKVTAQSSLPSKFMTMRHLRFAAFVHLLQNKDSHVWRQKTQHKQLPFTQEPKNYPGKCANPGSSCSTAGALSVRRWEQTPSGWKTASESAVVRQSISILSHIS